MANRLVVEFTADDHGVAPTIEQIREAMRGIGTTAREVREETETGAQATLIAFRSLGHGVQQASADFQAGTLTTQGYQEALARARREAIGVRQSVGDLSGKELNAYSSVIRNTTAQTAQATFGFGKLQSSIVRIASSAAGVPGPFGAIAGQVGSFAVGGPLMAGAALGFALLAKVLRDAGEEARDARKKIDEAIDRLLKLRQGLRTPEQQQGEDVASARDRRAEVEAKIARVTEHLNAERGRANRNLQIEAGLQRELVKLEAQRQETLLAINAPAHVRLSKERTAHEEAYKDALADVVQRLATARIQLQFVGKSHDDLALALRREELARKGLTAKEVEGLIQQEREITQLQRQRAEREAILRLIRETRAQVVAIPEPGMRGLKAPTEKPPAPAGSTTLDVDPLTGAETFAHQLVDSFDLSIGLVDQLASSLDGLAEGSLAGLEDAFEAVFDAIVSNGRVSGDQLVAGMVGAISKAAKSESAFYFARGVAALAASIFPFPRPDNAISAGQYFTAAALMGGVGLVTGLGARAIGGGGRGGGASLVGSDSSRIASESRVQQPPKTLVFKGDEWDILGPRFVDMIASAIAEGESRDVIVRRER